MFVITYALYPNTLVDDISGFLIIEQVPSWGFVIANSQDANIAIMTSVLEPHNPSISQSCYPTYFTNKARLQHAGR